MPHKLAPTQRTLRFPQPPEVGITSTARKVNEGSLSLRQYTAGTTEDFVNALNAALDKGTDETFSEIGVGYWTFLESIVARHRDEIATLPNCCRKAEKIRFMANLLRAEAKLPYDPAALDWAKKQTDMPGALQARVAQATGQSATQ